MLTSAEPPALAPQPLHPDLDDLNQLLGGHLANLTVTAYRLGILACTRDLSSHTPANSAAQTHYCSQKTRLQAVLSDLRTIWPLAPSAFDTLLRVHQQLGYIQQHGLTHPPTTDKREQLLLSAIISAMRVLLRAPATQAFLTTQTPPPQTLQGFALAL